MFFLTQRNMAEIRRETAIANSRARRAGLEPKGAQIVRFSCRCNCFLCECVEDRSEIFMGHGLYTGGTPVKGDHSYEWNKAHGKI
jgi:hypothetical protein